MEKSFELTMDQMEKANGGTQAENLLFKGKSQKAVSTVQKGAPQKTTLTKPKRSVDPSNKMKTIAERDGYDLGPLSVNEHSDFLNRR